MDPDKLAPPAYLSLLPEETVARLRRLELLARTRMQGGITGRHISPDKGASTEFAEHRAYAPGDDVRRLDWRAYARRDRYLIREYVEETNLRATVLLDASGSMAYAGGRAVEVGGSEGPASKFAYGRCLAAVLADFLIAQGDAAGLAVFDTELRAFHRPSLRRSHLHRILADLHGAGPGGETSLAPVLAEAGGRIPGRGLAVVISDLFDEPAAVLRELYALGKRGHEVVVFHVLADEELCFPFMGGARFEDLELPGEIVHVDPSAVRAAYLEKFGAFLDEVRDGCGRLGIHYLPLNTREYFDAPVARWLARR